MSREIESRYIRERLKKVELERKRSAKNNDDSDKPVRAAIYARVSTAEQANGYSIDEQVRACTAFARQKNWEIVQTYIDEGFTGTNSRRPGFRKLQRAIKKMQVDIVLAHKIDRVFRDTVGMLTLTPSWYEYFVLFASVREQVDFSTPWGRLLLTIFSALAEWFVNNLREETKKGLYGRVKSGLHNGPIPWGYCRGNCSACTDVNGEGYCPRFGVEDVHNEKYAVPHPVDSVAYRAAHELYRTGNYSDRDIADFLNAFTVQFDDDTVVQVRSRGKPGKGPGPFTRDFINDLLQNIFYTGWLPFYGSEFTGKRVKKFNAYREVEDGMHIMLITELQYDRAMDVRKLRGTAPCGKGQFRNASRTYILQGLLDCARCGKHMHGQPGGKNVRRHVCSTRLQRKGVCNQPSVRADIMEAEFFAQMMTASLPEQWFPAIIAYLVDTGGLESLAAQRSELRRHFSDVEFLWETDEISKKAFNKERRLFERQMAVISLKKHAKFNLDHACALLTNFPALWQRMTLEEQKGIADALLKTGVYDAGHVIEWQWYRVFKDLFAKL